MAQYLEMVYFCVFIAAVLLLVSSIVKVPLPPRKSQAYPKAEHLLEMTENKF